MRSFLLPAIGLLSTLVSACTDTCVTKTAATVLVIASGTDPMISFPDPTTLFPVPYPGSHVGMDGYVCIYRKAY